MWKKMGEPTTLQPTTPHPATPPLAPLAFPPTVVLVPAQSTKMKSLALAPLSLTNSPSAGPLVSYRRRATTGGDHFSFLSFSSFLTFPS